MKPSQKVVLFALLCSVSCGKMEEQKRTSNSKFDLNPLPVDSLQIPVKGTHGGKIISAIISEPTSFNPILSFDADSQSFNQIMGAGLTRLNLSTQEPEPALAKSWEYHAETISWTFHLRQGVRWSDGQPFSASDVLFTMQIVNDPNLPSGAQDTLLIGGKPVEWSQTDDHTVVAKLPSPFAPFLRQMDGGTVPIIPKHKWESAYRQGKFSEAMNVNMNPDDYVSLGAFRLKEYRQGQQLRLIRNSHYWKKDGNGNRLPYVDEIVFLIVPGADQVQLKMQSGELDTYQSIRSSYLELIDKKSTGKELKIHNVGPSYETEQLFFNQNSGLNSKTGKPYVSPVKLRWFQDLNFRRAVSCAIDRDSLVKISLFGKGVSAYGMESVNNRLWFKDPVAKFPYDPQRAVLLLRDSGFTQKTARGKVVLYDSRGNQVRFSLHTNAGNPVRHSICNLIVSDLEKIGIQVDYSPLDFGALVEKATASFDFEALVLSLSHDDIDPAAGMNIWKSSGSLHFWWPSQKTPGTDWEKKVDDLMDLQVATYERAQRKKYYNEVQEIIAEQQPIIFTVTQFVFVGVNEKLRNVHPSVARHRTLWNADEIYWAP